MWRIPQDENGRTSTLVTSTAQPHGSREDRRTSNFHKNTQDKTRQAGRAKDPCENGSGSIC